MKTVKIPSFAVIGKEGSTKDDKGIVSKLIKEASGSFSEVAGIGEKDSDGFYKGFWGAMSGFKRKLEPWENNYSEGLYLYGVQCSVDAIPPKGWVKWIIPEREYTVKEVTMETYQKTFFDMVNYFIPVEGYALSGAAFDYSDPKTNKLYIYFPIKPDPIEPKEGYHANMVAPCGLHCSYCFFKSCGGCLSKCNYCSFAAFQPDKKCPNVECSKGKGLNGCYECPDVENCHKGFYASEGYANSSAVFIKKHGKEAYERVIKKLLMKEKPYYTLIIEKGDSSKQLAFLESLL